MDDIIKLQPILNVGVLGHVAHGKSTLVRQITGIRTQKHSNENKTGRTIKLGYANVKIYKCTRDGCGWYYTKPSEMAEFQCEKYECNGQCQLINHISFVDAPGHEFLMTTMLNGAAVMDCAILVIAANEKVPQPQTQEHLIAAEIMGLKNILIVQNKIDTITIEKVKENAKEIREWVKGTCAENSKIVPISAHKGKGVQKIIESLSRLSVVTDTVQSDSVFACVRSFDINKPGKPVEELKGGVIGGTLLQGKLDIGDELTIRPGIQTTNNNFIPLKTKILGMQSEKNKLECAVPGGLIALETTLDPRFTCKDILVGSLAGSNLPELTTQLKLKYFLLKGTTFKSGDSIRITYLSRTVMGEIVSIPKKKIMKVQLKDPLCIIDRCKKLSISNCVGNQFRLVGVGTILKKGVDSLVAEKQFKSSFGEQLGEYDSLLEDVSDVCVMKTQKRTRVNVSPPECEKQGGVRTVWTNFGLIATQLGKPLEHFMSFITSELGTTTSLSASKALVLYGRYFSNNFESLIRSYVKKYCKCDSCGNCDTDLDISTNTDVVTCKYCGMSKSIRAVLKNNSKKGKGGKLKM